MGLPKLSSDGQFFVGAQTAVSLYVPTQTAGRLSLIAAYSAYTILDPIETGFKIIILFYILFLTRCGCARYLRTCSETISSVIFGIGAQVSDEQINC